MNSLIIKVLGASFPTYIIRDCINRIWRPKDPLKIIPLSNGYYIVSFTNKEDRDYAFQEGPWMINDHYLIVQRWRPNFNPWKADLQCRIAAWIQLLDVPFEFYNVESLHRIGNMIGKMIKVDRATSIYDKGGFARICVEIDLQQPLLPSYTVFGEERPIIYEGLHQVCFMCGRYGHRKDSCPTEKGEDEPGEQKSKGLEAVGSSNVKSTKGKEVEGSGVRGSGAGGSGVEGGATIITGEVSTNASPFGKIQLLRRESRGSSSSAGLRYEVNGSLSSTGVQKEKPDIRDTTPLVAKKDKIMGINGIKMGLTKEQGPPKFEWIQVGSKRKSVTKGKISNKEKLKGKLSREPACDLSVDTSVDHGATHGQGSSAGILQMVVFPPFQTNDTSCVVNGLQISEAMVNDVVAPDIMAPIVASPDIPTEEVCPHAMPL
ncbi:hypothetical protein K1719_009817 [Acacia pycnantha]|nr:hypothetical protein K1719_009817 [Acacia pycnantha]